MSLEGVLSRETLAQTGALAERFAGGLPFPHVVIDGFFDEAFCARLVQEFPPYEDARFRNPLGQRGKAHREDVRALGPAYARLDDCAKSPEFLRWLETVTGVSSLLYDPEYVGGGTHENLHGMDLEPHVDFNIHPRTGLHRRLNLLVYFTDWPAEWGGQLGLHSNALEPERDKVESVALKRNRCVLFETSDRSWHGVSRIRLPFWRRSAGRRSFALYYYTKARGDGARAIPGDLTMFLDPPLPEGALEAGRAPSRREAREAVEAVARRDRKIRYLYDRALFWYKEAQSAQDAARRLQAELAARRDRRPGEKEEKS